MASAVLSFVGRALLAMLFLSSGLQKLQTFDLETGGPVMEQMAPKMDVAILHVDGALMGGAKALSVDQHLPSWLPLQASLTRGHYAYILAIAIFLETAGSLLFVLDRPLGAQMLLLFTVPVTAVMHDFWNLPANSPEQFVDMVMAFKNVALVGALLMYLGMRR